MNIIHIVEESIWNNTNCRGQYFSEVLEKQGFIHCCLPSQVDFVVKNWFPEKNGLIMLVIDSQKLDAPVVFENLESGSEDFPHIYGQVNSAAIIAHKQIDKKGLVNQ